MNQGDSNSGRGFWDHQNHGGPAPQWPAFQPGNPNPGQPPHAAVGSVDGQIPVGLAPEATAARAKRESNVALLKSVAGIAIAGAFAVAAWKPVFGSGEPDLDTAKVDRITTDHYSFAVPPGFVHLRGVEGLPSAQATQFGTFLAAGGTILIDGERKNRFIMVLPISSDSEEVIALTSFMSEEICAAMGAEMSGSTTVRNTQLVDKPWGQTCAIEAGSGEQQVFGTIVYSDQKAWFLGCSFDNEVCDGVGTDLVASSG